MSKNPECVTCGDEIPVGVSRKATTHPATQTTLIKHADGQMKSPGGRWSWLENNDFCEVQIGDSDWVIAGVEGASVCSRQFWAYLMILWDYEEARESWDVPTEYSGEIEIVMERENGGFAEPVAYERHYIPHEQLVGDDYIDYELKEIGSISIRPTDLSRSGIDWDFWNERDTHPKDLYQRYVEDGQTVQEIADDLGVSGWTVRNWMDRAGIKRRNTGGSNVAQPELEVECECGSTTMTKEDMGKYGFAIVCAECDETMYIL